MPVQTVDATPSNALIRQCFPGRSDLLGYARSKPSQGSVPGDLTLAGDLAFVFNVSRVRPECCVDPLRPPALPATWVLGATSPLPRLSGPIRCVPQNCLKFAPVCLDLCVGEPIAKPEMSVMIASKIPAKLVAKVPPGERQNKGDLMTQILLLGLDPDTVDYSDPALPPGMTAEKVRAGIAVAMKQFADRGWESDVGFIRPDETAGPTVERQLRSTNYDCVVIGGGVRLPPRNLTLLEVVINTVRKTAPGATIAFNTWPDDSADAAARWVAAANRS